MKPDAMGTFHFNPSEYWEANYQAIYIIHAQYWPVTKWAIHWGKQCSSKIKPSLLQDCVFVPVNRDSLPNWAAGQTNKCLKLDLHSVSMETPVAKQAMVRQCPSCRVWRQEVSPHPEEV